MGASLVVIALGIASLLVARGRVPFTSDQAIPALMAMDILDGTAKPVFYYGVEYGGALEPWLLSGVFRIAGPSSQAYRATMALFLVAIVLGLWRTTTLATGHRTGAVVGIFVVLGPAYFYYKVLTSDGAYAALTLAGVGSLLLLVLVERRLGRGQAAWGGLVGLGVAWGVAFWVHLASVPYLAVGLLVGASWAAKGRIRGRQVVAVAAGFFGGSAPWWIRNAGSGFQSLRLEEASFVGAGRSLTRLGELFSQSLPTLLGPSSFRGPESPTWVEALLAATVAWVLADGFRRSKTKRPSGRRFLCRLAVLLVTFSVGAFLVPKSASPWEPRYLLPAAIGIAILGGIALEAALQRPDWRLALAMAPLVFAVASHLRAPRLRDFQRVTSDDPQDRSILFAKAGDVLSALSEKGVQSVYGSYWTVYRLVFLSTRSIAGAPLGRVPVDRMPEMTRRVALDPAPAFVLDGADLRDLEDYLSRRGFSAERTRVGGLVIITGVPLDALAEIRSAGGIPRT